MAKVVPAESQFSVRQSEYIIDPVACLAQRIVSTQEGIEDKGASYINTLVMTHTGNEKGMCWVWAQVTSGHRARSAGMNNLALAMPPVATSMRSRSSASHLLDAAQADDPTADIARRLTMRFKRPIYVSLNNVSASKMGVSAGADMMSLSLAMNKSDELVAVEKCLVDELSVALS